MRRAQGEAVVRILEEGNATAILRFGAEADLVRILQHPTTSIACDCGASTETRQHPRAWGTFPRVLGRYVRETNALTREDAIRKMTALPANTIGMVDRGVKPNATGARVTIDVSQAAGAPRAKGTFRLTSSRPDEVIESTEIGVLQTTRDWASFTAVVRPRSTGEESFVTVIVERTDPFAIVIR